MSSRINVLIPDGDSTWALSVIQCLSQVERYKLFVLSNKKRTASKYSRHIAYYKYYLRTSDDEWLTCITQEIKSKDIDIVIPIAEVEISFFIRYKETVSKFTKLIPLPDHYNFEIAKNKRSLSDFAIANHISHPKSFSIATGKDIQTLLDIDNFPVLVKPLGLKGGDGIKKIDFKVKLEKLIAKRNTSLFIQEYIEGYDIDCSVLCLNGKIMTHTIQKGNLEGNNIFEPQLGFDFLKNSQVLNLVEDVMLKLNWSGVAHLDLRYDKKAKDYKLIEINPRFWGSVEASRVVGINFPDLAIRLGLNETFECEDYKLSSYMRLKGVLKSIKRNPGFMFKRKYILNNTEVKSFLADPVPTFYKFREWLGRRF